MIRRFFKQSDIKFYNIDAELEGHIFCLDGNTGIYIFDDKLKKRRINLLPDKFKVISYNFNKKKQEVKEAMKFCIGRRECFEIEFENGKKVRATANHRFFNKNEEEVFVRDLKVGDTLLSFTSISGNIGKTKEKGLYNEKMGWQDKHISWCKGKTKREFPKLSRKGNSNYKGWNGGLTKETDERVRKYSKKLNGKKHPWQIGDGNVSKREDVRKKISLKLKGKGNGMYGKKHSKQTKELMSLSHSREKNPAWLGGISFEPYGLRFTKKFKREIRERDGFQCQLCGKKDIELSIHHVDYNKQNSTYYNCISLCNLCHLKTNKNREKWMIFFKILLNKKFGYKYENIKNQIN